MKSRTAATVVLYHPTDLILDNIKSYINAVEKLYIIDNSTKPNQNLIERIRALDPKIIYINNHGTQGIGHALNRAAREAIRENYQWLLTMDQDSRFHNINDFFTCCESYGNLSQVGVFAPNTDKTSGTKTCDYIHARVVITSGNFVNLKHYKHVNGYESKLFVDEIDHDFCLKLREKNIPVIQFPSVYMHHSIGDDTKLTSLILRKQKYRNIHSYQRIYYQTRNRLFMAKRHRKNYPEAFNFRSVLYKVLYKKGIRIIQWEPDKLRKLKAIYHGVYDYLNDNYGIYNTDSHH